MGDPEEEGLKLIQSRPEGVLQSELWKELGVDSRKCSRIVKKLEESGLINRIEHKKDGVKTYLLRAKRLPVNPRDLLAGDELIPCIGCELECIVEQCHPLMDWMYQLAIVQHTDYYLFFGSLEIIVFITFLGAFAVPTRKGKLKKMSIRTSSICDCKGAREDIRQGYL